MICSNCNSTIKEESLFCSKCGKEYEPIEEIQSLIKRKNNEKKYFNDKVTKLTNNLIKLNEFTKKLRSYKIHKINGRYSKHDVNFSDAYVYLSDTETTGYSTKFSLKDGELITNGWYGTNRKVTYEKFQYAFQTLDIANIKLQQFFKWIRYDGD